LLKLYRSTDDDDDAPTGVSVFRTEHPIERRPRVLTNGKEMQSCETTRLLVEVAMHGVKYSYADDSTADSIIGLSRKVPKSEPLCCRASSEYKSWISPHYNSFKRYVQMRTTPLQSLPTATRARIVIIVVVVVKILNISLVLELEVDSDLNLSRRKF